MREAIVGPVRGLYVAAYACETVEHDDYYTGAFKVYPFEPASSQARGHIAANVSKVRYPSAEVALHHAKLKGAAAAPRWLRSSQQEYPCVC